MRAAGCLVVHGTIEVSEDTLRPMLEGFCPVVGAFMVTKLEENESQVNANRDDDDGTKDNIGLELTEDWMVGEGIVLFREGIQSGQWVLLGCRASSKLMGRRFVQGYNTGRGIGFAIDRGHLDLLCGGIGGILDCSVHDLTKDMASNSDVDPKHVGEKADDNGREAHEILGNSEVHTAPGADATKTILLTVVGTNHWRKRDNEDNKQECGQKGRMRKDRLLATGIKSTLDRHEEHQQATHPIEIRRDNGGVRARRRSVVGVMTSDFIMTVALFHLHCTIQMQMTAGRNNAKGGIHEHEAGVLPVLQADNEDNGDRGKEDRDDGDCNTRVIEVLPLAGREDRDAVCRKRNPSINQSINK